MYSKKQRIAALVGIILLVLLYVITLICAIFNFDGAGKMFRISLFCSIALPILIWGYIWIYGKLTEKHTIASFSTKEQYEAKQEMEAAIAKEAGKKPAEEVTISKRRK